MSHAERIRDALATGPRATQELRALLGVSRSGIGKLVAQQRDAGVIVPLPGRYPRRWRLAAQIADPITLQALNRP